MIPTDFSVEKLKEFDNHRLVSFIYDEKSKLRGFIAIHRGGLVHPAFGATRIWKYKTAIDALKDVLKLSRLMSYKAALAGLPYGGGKAVIFHSTKSSPEKNALLKVYAQKVNYLGGHFITGADVGVTQNDLKIMAAESKYMVGTKSDPVKYTALGVFNAIGVCLKEVFGKDSFSQRTFAIQGLGKVGMALLKLVYPVAGKVYVSDMDPATLERAKQEFPNIEVVKPKDIYTKKVDVFSPCALSNAINVWNISKLHCKIVAGCANNQLQSSTMGELLHKLGILYAPDYLINAGGLIAVVDEFENGHNHNGRLEDRVAKIRERLKTVIATSKRKKKAMNIVADEMAEAIYKKVV